MRFLIPCSMKFYPDRKKTRKKGRKKEQKKERKNKIFF